MIRFLSCGATSINALVCHRFCVCVKDFLHDDWTSSNTRSATSCPSIVLVVVNVGVVALFIDTDHIMFSYGK